MANETDEGPGKGCYQNDAFGPREKVNSRSDKCANQNYLALTCILDIS